MRWITVTRKYLDDCSRDPKQQRTLRKYGFFQSADTLGLLRAERGSFSESAPQADSYRKIYRTFGDICDVETLHQSERNFWRWTLGPLDFGAAGGRTVKDEHWMLFRHVQLPELTDEALTKGAEPLLAASKGKPRRIE